MLQPAARLVRPIGMVRCPWRPLATLAAAASILAAQNSGEAPPPDLKEVVRRAIDLEINHQKNLENYTWQEEELVRVSNGPRRRKVWDHFSIDGSSYRKLVAKDGQPLPDQEARKEQEKMDREIAKRRNEGPDGRRKRLAAEKKEKEEAIRFREEVTRAFDFRFEGEELLNGFPAWRIAGTPRADFKPKSRDGKTLAKIRGRIWVHRTTGEWLKFDVETLDKLTFGWVVASVAPGARIVSEQMRVNDEFWHPQSFRIQLRARGLWMKVDLDVEERYRDFRRFQTDSRIIVDQ